MWQLDKLDDEVFWETGGIYREPDHPVVRLFAEQRVAHLRTIGALDQVSTVLDVGAGNGFSSIYYPSDKRVVAADYAYGMIANNPAKERLQCSSESLPFPAYSFDLVTCWELLHHVERPVTVIEEMLRVSKKYVIIFEPNRINPGHFFLALTRKNERRSLRFSPRYLRSLIKKSGGTLVEQHRCGLLFPNITPELAAKQIVRLPYRFPLLGISQLAIVEKQK